MAEEPEVLPSDDEGGGPVKSFLEHLEDLRWTLIRCVVAALLGIVLCLSAAKYIIAFLKWPLERAQMQQTSSEKYIAISLGTNLLTKIPVTTNSLQYGFGQGLGTSNVFYRFNTVNFGTNQVVVLEPDPTPPEAAREAMHVDLNVIGPAEAFTVAIQIAIYGGLTVSAPFLIFFIAQFILPALHSHEKKFLYRVSGFAIGLFLAGVAFCYLVMMVVTLSATVGFSEWLGLKSNFWKASEYISFMCWFMLGMGVSFELPLVLLTLVKIGILDAAKLSKFRAYWVVAGLTIAGFVTPDGNPLTMVLMFLPLHILYEASVIIAWHWDRKARKAALALERS
jgi:sec-independent protein translocase protein TatC